MIKLDKNKYFEIYELQFKQQFDVFGKIDKAGEELVENITKEYFKNNKYFKEYKEERGDLNEYFKNIKNAE